MTWTATTIAAIKAEWDSGHRTAEAIGQQYGVSKNVIVGLAYRNNWGGRRPARGDKAGKVREAPVLTGRIRACVWPFGGPRHSDFHFCGAPPVEGKPYCEAHCRRAYSNWDRIEHAGGSDR